MDQRTWWPILRSKFAVFDLPLLAILGAIVGVGLIALYSAGMDAPGRFLGQVRNVCIGFFVMWLASFMTPQLLMRFAVPLYILGVTLLVAVLMFGLVKKGARRWINIGVVIQPSEIMKIAMPLMLAWYFHVREGSTGWREFCIAALLLLLPFSLIAMQPDLGTAILVFSAGFYVIFLAGLSWKVLGGLAVGGILSLPIAWHFLHDYQRTRVLTLLDPTSDPLGKGFHIIQSMIAVGSGGVFGKGWLHGTQTHLEFIPERTTDFIFAVFSEEFGFVGNLILLSLYLLFLLRGMVIAMNAPTMFSRLLAGSITLIFFTYMFVNMGMVSGILPVVGVPLPLVSYGGTALVTLGLGAGILMSIARHRKLIQS
jgi:rod shape determining protein RodA